MTIAILTKMAIEKPTAWYKNVGKVQACLNSTFQTSIGMSPFELMVGVKMKQATDAGVHQLLEMERAKLFDANRAGLRNGAVLNIKRAQEGQRVQHNRTAKEATRYRTNDLVAIKWTQFQTAAKIKPRFAGPYRVSKEIGADRYEVVKVGNGSGPRKTSSSASNMKRWPK